MFDNFLKGNSSPSKDLKVVDVPLKDIKINYRFRNPSEIKVNGIADSISKVGLISPITLDSSKNLICGFHRYLAHKKLEKETIPSIIKSTDNRMSDLIQTDENLLRSELDFIEQSDAIVIRERLMDDLELTYKKGDNRYTKDESKMTIEDMASSIGLTKRAYQLRKQVSKIDPGVKEKLTGTEYANSLMNLVKLSSESHAIQKLTCEILLSGKTKGWSTALYEAKVSDYKLKTKPKLDFDIKDRFGVMPQSIMKFKLCSDELSKAVNIVNQDDEIRHIKSTTRFGLTPQKLHQQNPNQAAFSIDYYTNPNQLIVDPFVGRGTTAITSLYLQRRFVGFGIDEIANQKIRNVITDHVDTSPENWKIIDGDGCDMDYFKDQSEIIDGVFTSPPYYAKAEKYSESDLDLCNMSIEKFDERINVLFSNLKRLMKRSSYEDKVFYPAIFVVGTARRGKEGIVDMTHTFQDIAKKHDFVFWDQIFSEVNNPHLVSSLARNYENRFVNKNYESQIAFVRF